MKPILLYVMPAALACALAWQYTRKQEAPAPTRQEAPPSVTTTDAQDIFRRAFWRTPEAEDKILHAERREWNQDGELARLRWFLAVEPSPGLRKWLREENAFGLRPTKDASLTGMPEWFPKNVADFDVLSGGMSGGMALLFSRDGRTLYATGLGKGFTQGALEPVQPVAAVAPTSGRLPNTPPPNPLQP